MDTDRRYFLIKKIRSLIVTYFVGSICFILTAVASIIFGVYVLRNHDTTDIPAFFSIFSIAGIILLVEMIKSFRLKSKIPYSYRRTDRNSYPSLFKIIDEITASLGLQPVRNVYICCDATAAVFIQPRVFNLLREPERNIVIGKALLLQMDDDELRALLYHEFGHYVQKELNCSLSVYTVVQFSRVFLKQRLKNTPENMDTYYLKSQLICFTAFAVYICKRINKAYGELAQYMEYDADDVAVRHIGAALLKHAIKHALCIQYNFKAAEWGSAKLKDKGVKPVEIYTAVHDLCKYSFPPLQYIPRSILLRLKRLATDDDVKNTSDTTVRDSMLDTLSVTSSGIYKTCSGEHFSELMRHGIKVYNRIMVYNSLVRLVIKPSGNRHKLPLIDAAFNVVLDGKHIIGDAHFKKNYCITCMTYPGEHVVSFTGMSGIECKELKFNAEAHICYNILVDYKYKQSCYFVFAESITPEDN